MIRIESSANPIFGTLGDDDLAGTEGLDLFHLEDGGDDTAIGGRGADRFFMGAALTAADRLDGGISGHGEDSIWLDGDYSAGLLLGPATIVGIETMYLAAGHSYDLTFDASTSMQNVRGDDLGPADGMTIDGSAADHFLELFGGAGADRLVGSQHGDYLFGHGGSDTIVGGDLGDRIEAGAGEVSISAGGGDDTIVVLEGFDAGDFVDGEEGEDGLVLLLSTDAGAPTVLTADSVRGIERFTITGGYLVVGDGLASIGGNILAFDPGFDIGAVHFDGSAETRDGFDVTGSARDDALIGGAGADIFNGGRGEDTLIGGGGADQLTGGRASDRFVYQALTDATSGSADLIVGLTNSDVIDLAAIDANDKHAGNQAFHLVNALSHHRGELTMSYDAATGRTTVAGDVDGDGQADLVILLDGKHVGFDGFVL